MLYKILYTLFLVVCFFYPFEYVFGPVALRHIIALVLLVWLVVKKQLKFDRVLRMYVIYLFFFVLSATITGYLFGFIPNLVGTYILCIVMYSATKYMMKSEGGGWIFYTLLAMALLDSVVTIAQYLNLPLAQNITNLLRISLIDEETWEYYERYGGATGGLVAVGLLRGVKNGYFLCAAVVFSLLNKMQSLNIKSVLLCFFIFIALFVTQERAALYFGILCFVSYYLIINKKQRSARKMNVFVVIMLFVVVVTGALSFINVEETRYAILGEEADSRDVFWRRAMDFVYSHPLGGAGVFYATGGYPPHNFIPNSYVNGGIIGGTVIVALVIAQVGFCIKILLEAFFKKKHSMYIVALALIYIGYTGNSCFHNLALAMGDETAFMWWAILASLLEMEKAGESYINGREKNVLSTT